MKWSLFLLILMNQCSFSVCHLYKYYFIKNGRSWHDAQKYCREKYTDLATVYNMTDMDTLRDSAGDRNSAWIGLYGTSGNRTWHWSLPWVKYSENESQWNDNEPNDEQPPENCVFIHNKKLVDSPCTRYKYLFICYDDRNSSNKFHLSNDRKTWFEAQQYCRRHHTDLVSGLDQLEDEELTIQIRPEDYWIGLFRDTWRWSDGHSSSFRNWDRWTHEEGQGQCAVTLLNDSGKWCSAECTEKKHFFCYDDKFILIKQRKTWEDALNHCRQNYNNLVSITSLAEQRWVQERAKDASTRYVWLGLRYTCTLGFWFWVSDEAVHYKNWVSNEGMDGCDMSGAIDRQGGYMWSKKADGERFEFMCSKY